MTNRKKKIILLAVLVILLFVLSYLREVVFLQINALIGGNSWNYSNVAPPDFLRNMEKGGLIQLKWVFTALFSALFIALDILIINLYFEDKWIRNTSRRILLGGCGLLLLVGGIAYLVEIFVTFYPFLRISIGLLHSPILLFVLFIVFLSLQSLNKLKDR